MRAWLGLLALVVACSGARLENERGPGVAVPHQFGAGTNQPGKLRRGAAGDGGTEPGAVPASRPLVRGPRGSLPDPKPLRVRKQWEFLVTYDRGKLSAQAQRALLYPQPVVTPRRMGRYAIELWIGHELIERVRFDLPMLAAEAPRAGRQPLHAPPSLAAGATVTHLVTVPASERATRAVLVDRATGDESALPWPPEAPLGVPSLRMPGYDPNQDATRAASDAGVSEAHAADAG